MKKRSERRKKIYERCFIGTWNSNRIQHQAINWRTTVRAKWGKEERQNLHTAADLYLNSIVQRRRYFRAHVRGAANGIKNNRRWNDGFFFLLPHFFRLLVFFFIFFFIWNQTDRHSNWSQIITLSCTINGWKRQYVLLNAILCVRKRKGRGAKRLYTPLHTEDYTAYCVNEGRKGVDVC